MCHVRDDESLDLTDNLRVVFGDVGVVREPPFDLTVSNRYLYRP